MTESRVVPGGTPKWVRDATANDSDKVVLTVPAGKTVSVKSIVVLLTTTATVGNRLVFVDYRDASNNVIARARSSSTQAASLAYYYLVGPNQTQAAVLGTVVTMASADTLLSEGMTIRVVDNVAIDAAADDMVVDLNYIEYDA